MESKPRAKVVHLTSVHVPFDNRIFYKECRSLADRGYSVTLVAPHDKDDEIDGIRIRAVPKATGRRERMTRTVWWVYKAARKEKAKVYHLHDPELIPMGLMLRLGGVHVIYDAHEDLPRQILSKEWIPKSLRRIVAKGAELTEGVAARFLSGIVAATPAIARRFPAHKTVLVQNYPVVAEFVSVEAMPYPERSPLLAYVGGIATIRGAVEMVRAMELLPEDLNARLMLAGSFSPASLEDELRELPGWARVEFLGWQSRRQVAYLLGKVRVGLVLFHPVPNHTEAKPNKLFEYMAAGIPVIAADFPLWREIIEGVKCGVLVNPMNPTLIAEAIQWILEHPEEAEAMGRRGQEAVRSRYNWGTEAQKLSEFYRGLA